MRARIRSRRRAVQLQAGAGAPYELRQFQLADLDRLAPHIPPVELQEVERVKENLSLIAPLSQHLENRSAGFIATDGFAIDEKRPSPERSCGAYEGGEAFGPIVVAAREQPDAAAIAPQHGPVAIVLDGQDYRNSAGQQAVCDPVLV